MRHAHRVYGTDRPSRLERVRDWWQGVDGVNVVLGALGLAIVSAVGLVVWLALTDAPHYNVPSEYCTERQTGATRASTHMRCMAVGKNACGVTVPVTTTYHEVEIACRPFTTWR